MSVLRRWILGFICLADIAGLLIFGLWPFHHPKNQVTWLAGRNGLQLEDRSTVRSTEALSVAGTDGISIELWLQPEQDDIGTIVSFYDSSSRTAFSLREELEDLVLQRRTETFFQKTPLAKVYFDKLFAANTPVFLTITSTPGSTTLYRDGEPVKTLAGFSISPQDLSRILLVGDSDGQPDGWVGEFRGLAIYSRVLTATEARAHFGAWTGAERPDAATLAVPVALYLFDERHGSAAHSTGSTRDELFIPPEYSILDKTLLETPWNAFRPDWDYWKDVAINICGFMPLGLFAAAYLSPVPSRRAVLLVVVLGGAISLTIETLQWSLPTRDSDMTDVLTNTFGTWIGASLLRWSLVRRGLEYFWALCDSLTRMISANATN